MRTDTKYNSHLTVRTTPSSSRQSNPDHPTRSLCCQHACSRLMPLCFSPLRHIPCKLTGDMHQPSEELADPALLQPCPLDIAMPFAGDRMVTPWLKLLGKGAPDPPMLHISLKRTGSVLKKAKAEVRCVMTRLLVALRMSMCRLFPLPIQGAGAIIWHPPSSTEVC